MFVHFSRCSLRYNQHKHNVYARIAAVVVVAVGFAAGIEHEDIFVMAFNASNLI